MLIIGGALLPTVQAQELIPAPIMEDSPVSTTTVDALIHINATKYGVSYEHLYKTLWCESKLVSGAIGDNGTSFGVAQIHLPAHPDITRAQALDPRFAVAWAAKQFSLGHASAWTCYNLIYGSS